MREAFSFWTGHPFDFELWVRTGFWVAHGLSPYGVIPPVPGLSFANVYSSSSESTVGYLTLWPVLLAGVYELYALLGVHSQYLYYFLLKQPIILGDVALGYTILRFVKENRPEATNAVLAYWLLSPYTVILSGVWGMFDSLAMLPVIAALCTPRETRRSALEGLAIWVKSIPLIFAIPLAFSGPHRARNLAIALAIPSLGSLATILVAGWPVGTAVATLNSTVNKGGESLSPLGIFFILSQFGIAKPTGSLFLAVVEYVWIPAELVAIWLGRRWYGFTTKSGLVQSMILCSITFLLFKAQVNEQYAVYLLALALVDIAVWHPERRWLYFALTAAVLAFLLVNNVFLVRFTAPVNPGWMTTETALSEAMGPLETWAELISSLCFIGLNVLYFYKLYSGRRRRRRGAERPDGGPAVLGSPGSEEPGVHVAPEVLQGGQYLPDPGDALRVHLGHDEPRVLPRVADGDAERVHHEAPP